MPTMLFTTFRNPTFLRSIGELSGSLWIIIQLIERGSELSKAGSHAPSSERVSKASLPSYVTMRPRCATGSNKEPPIPSFACW